MVVEQGAACIVMLSEEASLGSGEKVWAIMIGISMQEMDWFRFQYWPTDIGKNSVYGEKPAITVSLVSEDESPSVLTQKFHVSSTKVCIAFWF